jgi:hypothetical protein
MGGGREKRIADGPLSVADVIVPLDDHAAFSLS